MKQHGKQRPGRPVMLPRLGKSLAGLARLTSELSGADSVEAVTRIVTHQIADAMDATIAALALREGAQVRLLGLRGLPAQQAKRWHTVPLSMASPATDVIRSDRTLVVVGADAIAARYPGRADMDRGERTIIALPLRVVGRSIGSIALSLSTAFSPDPVEVEFLEIMADTCAQALSRIRASAEACKQTTRLAFLAEASIALASSLDLEVTITRVAQLAVPTFADWCAIDVVRDGALHRLAVAHVDPQKVQLAMTFQQRWPADPSATSGAWAVVRSGRPELIEQITDQMLVAGARDAEHLRVARELHLRSAMSVPLLVRGRVSGVLTWVSTADDRLYDEEDLRFAEHLARRAATAIDNSELHSQTRAAAEQLQAAVHPRVVPPSQGWEVACYYQPSGRTQVGGDFYDGFPLEDGRYVIFIGDVMGRGVGAAAAMSEIRAAARAFASVDPEPASVLGRLDRMVVRYGTEQLVTMAYAVADPATGTLVVTNAGHLPPSVVRKDGAVEQLPYADGPPLGTSQQPRAQRTVALGAGDTLFAFTDGLVERRDEDIDQGLARLARVLPALAQATVATGLKQVVTSLGDQAYDDDIAAVALSRPG